MEIRMKPNKAYRLVGILLAAFMALAVVVPAFAKERQNIVEILISKPNFSTLVAAVVKADLVDALDGPETLTVFAPTNAAFDKLAVQLGYANGMALVEALPVDQLTNILLYHVTDGSRPAKTLFPPQAVQMLNGEVAYTAIENGGPTIDGQPIQRVDIRATNGYIHVIGGVMLP